MEAKSVIYNKLEAFIKKFYTNEIIKGTLLFIGIGLLYFIFTLLVEHFLWLSTAGRTFLFWLFVSVELFLLARFILFPFFKLFKLQKGLDYKQASEIIGNHFQEVNDKLLNFLQLSSQNEQSELLAASIEQKGNALQPIPFSNAIDFSKNKKYLPYALIPIIVLLLFFASGNSTIISNSFTRVVNYQTQYIPPAPFHFIIPNTLEVEQGKDFTLLVRTKGNVVPENVTIKIDDESYYLENVQPGVFQYTFTNVLNNQQFQLVANEVISSDYVLSVIAVPTISNLKMTLQFPSYLNRKPETIEGNGNAVVPEGTSVKWSISTIATNTIQFKVNGENSIFQQHDNLFSFTKNINSDLDYEIITSNKSISEYERLSYQLSIVKDQFPTITAHLAPDSLQTKSKVIIGQVADDYGLTKLQVVYYPKDAPNNFKKHNLQVKNGSVDQFVYAFPNGISLDSGIQYEYYFEVFDNNAVNHFKSAKSTVFKHYELTENEIKDKNLQEQNENINSLEKSIQAQDKQLSELDKLQKLNKEKSNLDFKDKKKIDEFLKNQKLQDEMMKEFSKKLSENLEEFNPNEMNKEKEELQRRLEELERNQKRMKNY